MRNLVLAIMLGSITTAGCGKGRPNTSAPEDALLFELGQAASSGDKEAALRLFDIEARQRLELWEKTLVGVRDQQRQLELLEAARPRLGEKAAMATDAEEAWAEVAGKPWVDELGRGKCVSGPVSKDDVGRGVMPREDPKKMTPEVGLFAFETRTMLNWAPTFRVTCPKSGTFWIQMGQRKKGDATTDPPLKVVRVRP